MYIIRKLLNLALTPKIAWKDSKRVKTTQSCFSTIVGHKKVFEPDPNLPSPKIPREPKWEKKALKGTKLKTNRWGFACKTNPKDCMTI